MLELSSDQKQAASEILDWFSNRYSNFITVGGYAGTGKTTLISNISDQIKNFSIRRNFNIAFCAYTGKASYVMRQKLIVGGNDYIGTIHGLIYVPVTKEVSGRKVIIGWRRRDYIDDKYDLVIIDEASMVDGEIFKDILSYGLPVIAVGDHGQLPPVGGKFNLMENPEITLTKIHRHDGMSPESRAILKLSEMARNDGHIPFGVYAPKVFKLSWRDPRASRIFNNINWRDDIICLCGINKSRVNLNNKIRSRLNNTLKDPYPGERIICLKNNHDSGMMNGMISTVQWLFPIGKDLADVALMVDGEDYLYSSLLHLGTFGKPSYDEFFEENFSKKYKKEMRQQKTSKIDLFDYGYATTVHKSQGSEWDGVVLFEQRNSYQNDNDYSRWLYTAVTRAKNRLFICTDYW